MELNINDYKVLLGALQSISIKGSDAVYIAGLMNKLQEQINKLETESQEEIKLDLPKSNPKSKK